MSIPLLGSIPTDIQLRKGGDNGVSLMVDSLETETGELSEGIGKRLSGHAGKAGTAIAFSANRENSHNQTKCVVHGPE